MKTNGATLMRLRGQLSRLVVGALFLVIAFIVIWLVVPLLRERDPSSERPQPLAESGEEANRNGNRDDRQAPRRGNSRSLVSEVAEDAAFDRDSYRVRLEELTATLWSTSSWAVAQRCLQDLVDIGSTESLTVVIEYMKDGPHHTHEPSFLADLLKAVDDPRIPDAATDALRKSILAGHHTWNVAAYADLMVRHGGTAEKQTLLELVSRETVGGQLRMNLASALAASPDPIMGATLLSAAIDRFRAGEPYVGAPLLRGLAQWNDPALTSSILELARDAEWDPAIRGEAYSAWGSTLADPERMGDIVVEYRQTRLRERYLVFQGLSAALRNLPSAQRHRALEVAYPMLRDALLSPESDDRLTVLSFVGDYLDFIPKDLVPALRTAHSDGSLSPSMQARMLSYAEAIEN